MLQRERRQDSITSFGELGEVLAPILGVGLALNQPRRSRTLDQLDRGVVFQLEAIPDPTTMTSALTVQPGSPARNHRGSSIER